MTESKSMENDVNVSTESNNSLNIKFKSVTHDSFKCPITHNFFRNPVTAMDGHIYENNAIKKWFKTKNTSPLTNLVIETTLIKSIIFDEMLKDFYVTYPEFKLKDYDYLVDVIQKKNHEKETIIEYLKAIDCINENRITSEFKDDGGNKLMYLFDQGKELINFIIDHHNIDYKGYHEWQLIHFICRFGSLDMLKRIIDRGANCEAMTTQKWKPIHYICSRTTLLNSKDQYEAIKLLTMNGVDVECKTDGNFTSLAMLCDINENNLTKEYMFSAIQLVINAGAEVNDFNIILTKKIKN